ncbi:endonuclease/exonuclease/phosphatase family protein [Desulfopila inferna]|uniref:endonuclease/exonuclease/phosphatase family protein n=1 Tax=Desulfopila inferna TaxID=468528 RepID=UPI0019663EEF|nr:endonuclease/exonuclease/phosphatase family protein [Desulfopila inferna]MBM9606556.1 endonuclease/exonuclease/phosphatase family protein [Desulfopila inferna]
MEKLLGIAWYAAVLFLVVSTLLPIIRSDEWWIRWFDFPRLQLLTLGGVLVVLQLLWRPGISGLHVVIFAALIAAIGYQGYRIFPYTQLAAKQVKHAGKEGNGAVIRIVTANVLMHNRMAQKYLTILNDINPDIILTTEADQWWSEQLQVLDSSYPYHLKYPLDNTYGMILHSKFPLLSPAVEFLVEPGVPSIHSDIRLPGGQVFRLIGLHPRPPGPNKDSTARDAELIITAERSKKLNQPVLVLGDLNDVAWSHTTNLFQKISSMLDPRIGRGMYNTFNAKYFFIRFPLDHIFHSSHFKYIDMRRLPAIGSDHFPFYAALSLEAVKDSSPEEPAAPSPGEKEEADDIRKKPLE